MTSDSFTLRCDYLMFSCSSVNRVWTFGIYPVTAAAIAARASVRISRASTANAVSRK